MIGFKIAASAVMCFIATYIIAQITEDWVGFGGREKYKALFDILATIELLAALAGILVGIWV